VAKTAKDMVSEAKAQIENLTPQQVAEEAEQGALIVDVRDGEERQRDGGLPGSVHVPRGMLEFRADPTSPYYNPAFDPGKRVVLHCASGGRSALAAKTLKEMGYTDVAHLEGGFNAWKDQGLPVTKES
jgi:rhodanese-related sulfurtransferase